jgi:murein DD-endopeptidase MepM/ murein hydrolase activator NlpD
VRHAGGIRIAAVSSLVVAMALAGAAALWLYTRASEPAPTASRADRAATEPPIRLDTLPPPTAPERSDGRAKSGRGERRERGSPGGGGGGEGASKREIREELAALAADNAGIVALLRGDKGPGPGSGEIVWPLRGPTIARFGRGLGSFHAGIDIEVPAGTPVHAADAGRVATSGVWGAYGKFVCIQHTGTLSTCYAHNSRLDVSEGDSVDSGDVIALSGCSGRCYDDHLHFEVRDSGRAVNPRDYL